MRDVDPKENGAKLFGYDKNDRLFDKSIPPKTIVPEPDIIIAHCKINLKSLSKGISGFVNGEYALYPPKSSIVPSCRELFCTNDVNSIKGSVKPEFIIPISVVLEAQMTLEASLGLVGCTHRKLQSAFSRLYSSITDNDAAMSILSLVTNINDDLVLQGRYCFEPDLVQEYFPPACINPGDFITFSSGPSQFLPKFVYHVVTSF